MNILEVRNPVATIDPDLINCEIRIDTYPEQWLSFGAHLNDIEAHGRTLYQDIKSGVYGKIKKYSTPAPGALSVEEQASVNVKAIEAVLDNKAKERGYSGIKSACAYASPVPFEILPDDTAEQIALKTLQEKFRREGNALQAWMSLTWAKAYMFMESVKSGTSEMITSSEAIAMMPEFVWPE